MSHVVVAVDGPAASGKSSVSRRVAKDLGFHYVDSGALYRVVTWLALEEGLSCEDQQAITAFVADISVAYGLEDQAVTFTMNGHAPGDAIRTPVVNDNVSYVAVVAAVRERVVAWLRDMATVGDLVMEGRDIGSKVFPDADFKFYLDASLEVRAQRRTGEYQGAVSAQDVAANLKKRDTIDRGRKVDPLKVAANAEVVDTSDMTLEGVVAHLVERVRQGSN